MAVDDLTWMREWLGSGPADADLQARLDAYEGVRTLAAISLLRQRRADMLADPLSYSIRGDVTVNAQANMKALDDLIAQLEAQAVEDGDLAAASDALAGMVLERQDTWGRGWPVGRIPS